LEIINELKKEQLTKFEIAEKFQIFEEVVAEISDEISK
jgi:hypothetical protein